MKMYFPLIAVFVSLFSLSQVPVFSQKDVTKHDPFFVEYNFLDTTISNRLQYFRTDSVAIELKNKLHLFATVEICVVFF